MNSCIKFSQLETERLILEPLKETHAEILYPLFYDIELYHYIKRDLPESLEKMRFAFKTISERTLTDKSELWLNWVPKEKTTQKYVGYFETSFSKNEVYLAYTTFRPHWRKGYAKEGMREIIQFIQKEYRPQKFIIEMDTRNRASTKLAESLGFQWMKTTNHAEDLKGYQSHEFRFEYLTKETTHENH